MTGPNAQTCSEEGGDFLFALVCHQHEDWRSRVGNSRPGNPQALLLARLLGKAVCWGNLSETIPNELIRSLHSHPARLLSWMDRKYYTPLKRRTIAHVATQELATGRYDCFHGWSGESLGALREAKKRGLPTLLDIPTCHRDKGKKKPRVTKRERDLRSAPIPQRWLNRILIMRSEVLDEYDLADLILVFSQAAKETFLDVGFEESRLFYVAQGVNMDEYPLGNPPDHFRLIFVGSLIKRKGVHHLLKVWQALNLKNAELVIVGGLTAELEPYVKDSTAPLSNSRICGECRR